MPTKSLLRDLRDEFLRDRRVARSETDAQKRDIEPSATRSSAAPESAEPALRAARENEEVSNRQWPVVARDGHEWLEALACRAE
jgi:hypothetical protein